VPQHSFGHGRTAEVEECRSARLVAIGGRVDSNELSGFDSLTRCWTQVGVVVSTHRPIGQARPAHTPGVFCSTHLLVHVSEAQSDADRSQVRSSKSGGFRWKCDLPQADHQHADFLLVVTHVRRYERVCGSRQSVIQILSQRSTSCLLFRSAKAKAVVHNLRTNTAPPLDPPSLRPQIGWR
jgi:hypothetical protein